MSIFWVAVLALSGSPSEGQSSYDAYLHSAGSGAAVVQEPLPQQLLPPRTGHELEVAVHAALRHWARPNDREAAAAAREFIVLYKELQGDIRLTKSQREELRLKVRSRLVLLSQQISKRIARETHVAQDAPKSVKIGAQDMILGQMGQPAGGGMQGFGGGGGAQGFGGGNNANDDNGQQLVDLIQTTIAPQTWDVNGGPGSIFYWQQQHAIVVRASEDVHEEISGLIDQLNRAGN
ncbi:MAG: hypothetical protein ABSG68_17340 [Thermoguttaceae bacterium]|jgi:hypothetical protein